VGAIGHDPAPPPGDRPKGGGGGRRWLCPGRVAAAAIRDDDEEMQMQMHMQVLRLLLEHLRRGYLRRGLIGHGRDPDRYRPELRHTQNVRNLVPKTILLIISTLYNKIEILCSIISLRLPT
jgi:hypothetical protein